MRNGKSDLYSVMLLFSIVLGGCHFFGPRDRKGLTMITDKAKLKNLDGVWMATNLTYETTRKLKYPADSIKIILHKDSSFEAFNIPDCLAEDFGRPVTHLLLHATARWGVTKDGKYWAISMDFKPGELYKKGVYTFFDVYFMGDDILMNIYAGDPDEGEILEFKKVKSNL